MLTIVVPILSRAPSYQTGHTNGEEIDKLWQSFELSGEDSRPMPL